ncbi:MAG: hypothetical protein M1818_007886 [Claussenomyces sp. TS43310]|nr:MAG: hypothetical protein M1818_007886 [Claussenomyces sp. TS43310]
MASLLSGFQLPFQRRLTKMYTDTKSSYDFLKEPVQVNEDSELSSLHRKLRIQKDRLISWGLGWSDPSQSPDIDESLSRAGLGDVVGSVMSTIKDILAEAEPLWQSSKKSFESKGQGSDKAGDSKSSLISWDRSRFEDLMRDLTSSIDILYDLSRTRQTARSSSTAKQAILPSTFSVRAKRSEQRRKFESTRIKTPQQIHPSHLITPDHLRLDQVLSNASGIPRNDGKGDRQIVYLQRQTSSTSPWLDGPPTLVPVLLEYAAYDSLYANTGVPPPMDRFEKLFAGLQIDQDATRRPDFGLLNLAGYFEDTSNAQLGLVYELPSRFGPIKPPQSGLLGTPYIATLSDILSDQALEPSLETKFRLAYNLAIALAELHSRSVVHGNLEAGKVGFFEEPTGRIKEDLSVVNLRRPFLMSFALFPDMVHQGSTEGQHSANAYLHNHNVDPRLAPDPFFHEESRSIDLHNLGMLLLQIGLWMPLSQLISSRPTATFNASSFHKRLANRCGLAYLKAVETCWDAVESEISNRSNADVVLDAIYEKVGTNLERCCSIDDELGQEDVFDVTSITSSNQDPNQHQSSMNALLNTTVTGSMPEKSTPWSSPGAFTTVPSFGSGKTEDKSASLKPQSAIPYEKLKAENTLNSPRPRTPDSKLKLRLFPTAKIEQQHLDYWHAVIMPRINHALRGFYRKYPESVEISLESIGETASKTKPTILVVCTSVGKVRGILRKHFVYDSSTYGLMVCRGQVFRSRKNLPRRSTAGEAEPPQAMNPDYQERPSNGASIGAYVEGQHLPPVSFGGMIKVDEKYYGMSVHHMLDDPGEDESLQNSQLPTRAWNDGLSGTPGATSSFADVADEGSGRELSEYESDVDSDLSSDAGSAMDEQGDFQPVEPGDVRGISEGCGKGYTITQPALDDVDEGFFPSEEDIMEDHLDTFRLGEIYASSGIRRRIQDGMTHEIDWALFEFSKDRQPSGNCIKGGEKFCRALSRYPVEIAPWSSLHGLEVHCNGRSTGLQTGRILPGMTSVKIFGRQTPSQSFQVSGRLGIPGDSGAWIIDNVKGRACGHILAWSSRKQVAYICPMEILISDISETLNATVTLPDAKSMSSAPARLGITVPQETVMMSSASERRSGLLSSNVPRMENVKHLANVRYNMTEDDLATAMSSMHVSHQLASPN